MYLYATTICAHLSRSSPKLQYSYSKIRFKNRHSTHAKTNSSGIPNRSSINQSQSVICSTARSIPRTPVNLLQPLSPRLFCRWYCLADMAPPPPIGIVFQDHLRGSMCPMSSVVVVLSSPILFEMSMLDIVSARASFKFFDQP